MSNFVKYFDGGIISQFSEAYSYRIMKGAPFFFYKLNKKGAPSDMRDKIILFFVKYPILGSKAQDFYDFCKVADLMKDKKHLTPKGLDQICKIKEGMNNPCGKRSV